MVSAAAGVGHLVHAVCGGIFSSDITSFHHIIRRKNEYWLIDKDEAKNIKVLSEFAHPDRYRRIIRTVVRVFYQDDAFVMLEQEARRRIREPLWERQRKKLHSDVREQKKPSESEQNVYDTLKNLTDGIAPAIIRTWCYHNLAVNLLQKYPLYHPLIGQQDPRALNVAILGNGEIGTELFLNVIWSGQLLEIPLSVNMVSKDSVSVACAAIDRINPEILESTRVGSELLRIYPDGEEKNAPYFTFRYCMADMDRRGAEDITCEIPRRLSEGRNDGEMRMRLLDADYFIVALGADATNIRVAEELHREIIAAAKEEKVKAPGKQPDPLFRRVVIAYVVYDSTLCTALNGAENPYGEKAGKNIRMLAVGSLDEIYSSANVMMLDTDEETQKTCEDYLKYTSEAGNNISTKPLGSPYEYWSSCAANRHYSAKCFSGFVYERRRGLTGRSWKDWQDGHREYIGTDEKDPLVQKLAWLEHRRWNAYMRSIGFRGTEMEEKELLLQRHPALVESAPPDKAQKGRKDCLDQIVKRKPHTKHYDMQLILEADRFDTLVGNKKAPENESVGSAPEDKAPARKRKRSGKRSGKKGEIWKKTWKTKKKRP